MSHLIYEPRPPKITLLSPPGKTKLESGSQGTEKSSDAWVPPNLTSGYAAACVGTISGNAPPLRKPILPWVLRLLPAKMVPEPNTPHTPPVDGQNGYPA